MLLYKQTTKNKKVITYTQNEIKQTCQIADQNENLIKGTKIPLK